ncbi:hypothetical protein GWA97_02855 [Flavobacterium sp. LaA7.5]|nr:hypothetical protein [Flavobacterium salilacus subsp. altitudinum]
MKKFALIPTLLILFSCGSTKSLQEASDPAYSETSCPTEGGCTFEVLKNKSLVIKKDGIDKLYYSIADNPATSVVKYRYDKKANPRLPDSGYAEEVVFEIANDSKALDYKDSDIAQTKMLFGVMCFCKGKAGFYPVTSGTLAYKNNVLHIALPELVDAQKLKDISIAFK